jgi:hypothetical protein
MSPIFRASTQYGDWNGTAAADLFGDITDKFDELFEATGEVEPDKEIMIGFGFYNTEGSFFLAGYFHRKPAENESGWYPTLKREFQRKNGPIKVKKVRVQITLEQFFKYFKRFNVVLAAGALDIAGREFEIDEN